MAHFEVISLKRYRKHASTYFLGGRGYLSIILITTMTKLCIYLLFLLKMELTSGLKVCPQMFSQLKLKGFKESSQKNNTSQGCECVVLHCFK